MSRKIATLWDNKDSEDSEEHGHPHGAGQAFYAGGSEHSGQQILGPNRDDANSDRLVETLFEHARQSAASYADSNEASRPESGPNTLPIIFWRNGFTIGDDGELRDYLTSENRQFLESLKRGETPPELASRTRGGAIDVKLQNKAGQDYQPERKLKAFSGEGRRLGAPAPETMVEGQPQSTPNETVSVSGSNSGLVVDESQPVTSIQVRLVDNTRLVIRVNNSNRVGDLVSHIRAIRPQYSSTNFILALTFPAKELTDLEQTISEAKLANASVIQKIKH